VDLFSTDPDRPGVFAVGQIAYGVFALGQMATGVIAVGQVARGVIAIGQGAVGFIAIGQGAIGVFYTGGMLAVGSRGFGGVLQIMPKVTLLKYERPKLPPLSPLAHFSKAERGWLLAELKDGALQVDGQPLGFDLSADAREQVEAANAAGHNFVCITVEVIEELKGDRAGAYREAAERDRRLSAKRMSSWYEGPPRLNIEGPLTGIGGLFLRSLGFVALIAAWWLLAGSDIFAMFT